MGGQRRARDRQLRSQRRDRRDGGLGQGGRHRPCQGDPRCAAERGVGRCPGPHHRRARRRQARAEGAGTSRCRLGRLLAVPAGGRLQRRPPLPRTRRANEKGASPVRIAVIAPPWLPVPPVGYGGTELVLDTLCRGLVAQGHEVLLYATGDSACPVERAWTYDRHLGVANMTPADELRHVMDAYDAAERWGADIVHDHTVSGPVWAQVHSRLPVITTNHGPFAEPLSSVYRRIAPTVPIIAISQH